MSSQKIATSNPWNLRMLPYLEEKAFADVTELRVFKKGTYIGLSGWARLKYNHMYTLKDRHTEKTDTQRRQTHREDRYTRKMGCENATRD